MDGWKHCLCIVTGASRGFGRAIVESLFSENGVFTSTPMGSRIVLIARDKEGLQETRNRVLNHAGTQWSESVDLVPMDFSDIDMSVSKIEDLCSSMSSEPFERCILFNNAGDVGDVSRSISDAIDKAQVQYHFNVNVIVPCMLTSIVCKAMKSRYLTIVNISSLAAISAMPFMGLYCSGKAAMDMYAKVLAIEDATIRVLNYAPGPMDTNMARNIRDNSGSLSTRDFFQDLFVNEKIIKPLDSALKMVRILKEDSYTSGAHIDFYDVQ